MTALRKQYFHSLEVHQRCGCNPLLFSFLSSLLLLFFSSSHVERIQHLLIASRNPTHTNRTPKKRLQIVARSSSEPFSPASANLPSQTLSLVMSPAQGGAFEGVVPSADVSSSSSATSVPTAAHSAVVHDTPPSSPLPPAFSPTTTTRQSTRTASYAAPPVRIPGSLYPPSTLKGIDSNGMPDEPEWTEDMGEGDMVLELADGLALAGHSFGAEKSVAGECVFQTGKSRSSKCEILVQKLMG